MFAVRLHGTTSILVVVVVWSIVCGTTTTNRFVVAAWTPLRLASLRHRGGSGVSATTRRRTRRSSSVTRSTIAVMPSSAASRCAATTGTNTESSSNSSSSNHHTHTPTDLVSIANFVKSVKKQLCEAATLPPIPPTSDTNDAANTNTDAVLDPHHRPYQDQQYHLVMGNEAGDADSIISAIGFAYVKALQQQQQQHHRRSTAATTMTDEQRVLHVPVVSIPAAMLHSQRPETVYLLTDCAQIPLDALLTLDDPPQLLPSTATLTLTDHNYWKKNPTKKKTKQEWSVTEILDHHLDAGYHTDTCPTQGRTIAFDATTRTALVASTATLVAEQYYATATTSLTATTARTRTMPPSLAILLFGTILLDSINMSPSAQKGTDRDAIILHRLLYETDWDQLALPHAILVEDNPTDEKEEEADFKQDSLISIDIRRRRNSRPDPTKLFQQLQQAKFAPQFWQQLTPVQAIRMDYKTFQCRGVVPTNHNGVVLGLGSILVPMEQFLGGTTTTTTTNTHNAKTTTEEVYDTMARIMDDDHLALLGLLFFSMVEPADPHNSQDEPGRRRQLMLASYQKEQLEHLVASLQDAAQPEEDLQLHIHGWDERDILLAPRAPTRTLYGVRLEQGNTTASRKQIAPILMEFFSSSSSLSVP